MPVILYNVDNFKNPPFIGDLVFSIDDVIDVKLHIAHLNESQVYEWLPFNENILHTVPKGEKERFEWLKGMNITPETADEEVMAAPRGYAVRFAKVAARFRNELIARYGKERGAKVRYDAFCYSV